MGHPATRQNKRDQRWVYVTSYDPLNAIHDVKVLQRLKKRFQNKVSRNNLVDNSPTMLSCAATNPNLILINRITLYNFTGTQKLTVKRKSWDLEINICRYVFYVY